MGLSGAGSIPLDSEKHLWIAAFNHVGRGLMLSIKIRLKFKLFSATFMARNCNS